MSWLCPNHADPLIYPHPMVLNAGVTLDPTPPQRHPVRKLSSRLRKKSHAPGHDPISSDMRSFHRLGRQICCSCHASRSFFRNLLELKRHHCERIKSSYAGQRHILHPNKDPHTLDIQARSSKAVENL